MLWIVGIWSYARLRVSRSNYNNSVVLENEVIQILKVEPLLPLLYIRDLFKTPLIAKAQVEDTDVLCRPPNTIESIEHDLVVDAILAS
jgi:hypothetical protein